MGNLKNTIIWVIVGVLTLSVPSQGSALTDSASQVVNVIIPHVLKITSDTDQFTLHFQDFKQGSETDTKTVNYYIEANGISRNSGVVQGALNADIPNVQIKADVGNYQKEGGNANLIESASGFVPLSNQFISLANREILENTGMVVRGNLSITYKASALKDLEHKTVTPSVTITIFDN